METLSVDGSGASTKIPQDLVEDVSLTKVDDESAKPLEQMIQDMVCEIVSGASAIASPKYEVFWRKGYGPEGGDEMDPDGWKDYLDDLEKNDRDAYNLMLLDVFSPEADQHDQHSTMPHVSLSSSSSSWSSSSSSSQSEIEDDDRVDGIDSLTEIVSGASAIACPEFEVFWRKGYGPEGGDKMDRDGWEAYLDDLEKNDRVACNLMLQDVFSPEADQHSTMPHVSGASAIARPKYSVYWRDSSSCSSSSWSSESSQSEIEVDDRVDGIDSLTDELWDNYARQIKQNEPVDRLYDFPGPTCPPAMHFPTCIAKDHPGLVESSKQALELYNRRQTARYYKLHQVVKANVVDNMEGRAGVTYFITFEAVDLEHRLDVFQAKAFRPIEGPQIIEVLQVSLKASYG